MARKSRPKPADLGRKPRRHFERPPDASETNRDGPVPPGTRKPVPGAGVVDVDDQAGPNLEDPKQDYPGKTVPRPLRAMPGAQRPSTQVQGNVPSVPVDRGPGVVDTGHDPTVVEEMVNPDGAAPLSTPSDRVGPYPPAPDVPELYDPNYTAKTGRERQRKQKRRPPA
jgi:hypothetical protein